MTDKVNLREIVLDILMEVNEHGNYSHLVINNALGKFSYLDKSQRSFITRLAEGTIEKSIEMDYIIDQFSTTKVCKMKPLIRNLLRMSVYQIKYMTQVPVSAACNEAVKLAVKRGFAKLKGFVNGVLRNIARQIESIPYPDREKEPLKHLSVTYSCPEWIIEKWLKNYDRQSVERILTGFEKERSTYIRCNRSLLSPMELRMHLENEGIRVEEVKGIEYAFKISGYDYIGDIQSFTVGEFQIQDISSIIAGAANEIHAGDFVLDVCAAPGGKCLHAADILEYQWKEMCLKEKNPQKGHVEARDISPQKTALIEENIQRLKAADISVKVWDATTEDSEMIEKADVVLADLPCSGLGIMGRKGDIKYKMTPEKQQQLVQLQREILSVIWKYVKPGGILMYTTCTINEDENVNNVKWFTEKFPFELESLEHELSFLSAHLCMTNDNKEVNDKKLKNNKEIINDSIDDTQTLKLGYIQLLPGIHETDGFFISKLRRKKS